MLPGDPKLKASGFKKSSNCYKYSCKPNQTMKASN
jgi:hypothetical protein